MRISFNKASVCLMYVMVIGYLAVCLLIKDWPPAEFTYCWFGFWVVQALVTAHLEENKRAHKRQQTFLQALVPYINEDNAEALVERWLDVDIKPERRKRKQISKSEEKKDSDESKDSKKDSDSKEPSEAKG
jgi:hypothetical protein